MPSKQNVILWSIIAAFVMGLMLPPILPSQAADIEVSNVAELTTAISTANANDTIKFGATGTFVLTSTLNIDKALTFTGLNNDTGSVTIQSPANAPAFTITNATTVNINLLTIDGNNAGAGIVSTGTNVNLTDVEIVSTTSSSAAAAIDFTGGTGTPLLTLSETTINNNSGTRGAIYIMGDAGLNFNKVTINGNTATDAANFAGGLTFNSTSSTAYTLERVAIYNNTGRANLYLPDGNLDLVNVTLSKGSQGIEVASGAKADLSFVTVAENTGIGVNNNTGGTINARSVISAYNGTACSGSIDLDGRSIFFPAGSCTLNISTPGSMNINKDPIISPVNNGYAYSLGSASPAIDRSLQNTKIDPPPPPAPSAITTDIIGTNRPRLNYQDIGSHESASATLPAFTVGSLTVTEGNSDKVKVTSDIEPIGDLVITFAVDAGSSSQCSITGGNPVTLNDTNYDSTGGEITVEATEDSDAEGNHTCTLTASINNNGDRRYDNVTLDNITVNITDNDTVANPALVPDFSAFAAPFMAEGDARRNTVYKLAAPPSGNVQFNVTTTAQCDILNPGTHTLNADTWNTGIQVEIGAAQDGVYESAAAQCTITATVVGSGTTYTNTIDLAPDNPQEILVDKTSASGAEGIAQNFNFSTERIIGSGSTESYTLVPIETTSPNQCVINTPSITLDKNSSTGTITITPKADGLAEGAHSCTINITVSSSTVTPPLPIVPSLTINIYADPVASPNLTVRMPNDTVITSPQAGTIPITVVNEGNYNTLQFQLEQSATAPQVFTITRTSIAPSNNGSSQCTLQDSSGNPLTTLTDGNGNPYSTFNLQTLTPTSLRIVARDDDFGEPSGAGHSCTFTVTRDGNTLFTFEQFINDNDSYSIYTRPTMSPTPLLVAEGYVVDVIYGITNNPGTGGAQINFTPPANGLCSVQNTSGATITSITLTDSVKEQTVRVFAPTNGITEANRNCTIKAVLNSIPPNYSGYVGDTDTFVPDILAEITDSLENPQGDPVSATPTPVGGVQVVATSVPIPTALPTAIPVKAVRLDDGIQRVPVRTGPYLGASLVTMALRTTDETAEIEGQNTLAYEVFAKNNDENADITWYFIEVNGRQGWVSGGSVTLFLNDVAVESTTTTVDGETFVVEAEDGLPFVGSVFDTLSGAPDVGVIGSVTRERLVYRRPSTRTMVIGSVPANVEVSILNRTREISYDDWYQIRWNGVEGWVMVDANAGTPSVIADPELLRDRVPVR